MCIYVYSVTTKKENNKIKYRFLIIKNCLLLLDKRKGIVNDRKYKIDSKHSLLYFRFDHRLNV